jgi:conjugative relaxase-like TrwC/TraI family protein
VLRVSKLTDAEYVLDAVAGGVEDYYLGGGEAPGVWAGRLAGELGLVGVVGAEDLRALIDRVDPASGDPLTPGSKPVKVRAVDTTFSAPKSVSLLHALADAETASVLGIAHVDAVAAALSFLEDHAAVTRQQCGGVRRRVAVSGWAAATFVHRTSREGDPQLHTHAVIANLVRRPDGTWAALDAAACYGWAKAAGSIYQEHLRRNLTAALGVGWGPDRNGCREMVGISDAQRRVFSKRTAQIEAHLAGAGSEPATAKGRMQADEAASLATRRRKNREWTPAALSGRWAGEASAVGLPTGRALVDQVRAAACGGARRPSSLEALFARLVDPEGGLCAHDSRFGEAQVVEQVAAAGAGAWTSVQVEALAKRFLSSRHVVRLLDADPAGRTPPRWSTVAHRHLEDRVLDHLERLSVRIAAGVETGSVEAAIVAAGRLGDDQADAVRTLCGAGPALRALISPAGHGKTTALAAATAALAAAGRPVLALSSTNQAVEQLRRAGLDATTIARFALEAPTLAAGTVVICDEVSQLPTGEADVVLGAVTACPDGQVWLVGDPHQAQPVGAGGLAHYLTAGADHPPLVTAFLSVNHRQADPAERDALVAFRADDVATSQAIRHERGWEHHPATPAAARAAMAHAVVADVAILGVAEVVALAATHVECEDLADRIRAALAQTGRIVGPSLEGPGWSGPRSYQTGDRIVLHSHLRLDDGSRLTNGTTATVTGAGPDGLVVLADGHRQQVTVPAAFVADRSGDGRPRLSHAWCRTIDGVQGGTWAQVHLLATPALDHYRGYVGQSRGVRPTHTWNTTPAPDDDHGGRLVGAEGAASEQVAAALGRARPKTFAAGDDPHHTDRRLRRRIADHQAVLDRRPPDLADELAATAAALDRSQAALADAHPAAERWAALAEESSGGLRGLTPAGRARRHDAEGRQAAAERSVTASETEAAEHAARLEQLRTARAGGERFAQANACRADDLAVLQRRREDVWAAAVVAAARHGDPLAYGLPRLSAAREHLMTQAAVPDPGPTADPDADASRRAQARTDLTDLDAAIAAAARAKAASAVERAPRQAQVRLNAQSRRPGHDDVVAHQGIGPDL